MGPGARGLVVTVGDGYALGVAPEALDVHRFERGVEEGRRLLAAGSASPAEQTLAAALALWRAEPLPELVDSTVGQAERARLAGLQEGAVDAWSEAALAAGHHDAVIARLVPAVQADPHQERRWGQLMIALYRAGRQVDALRTYQRARSALLDLGLEPGPGLQRLEAAVVAHDDHLSFGSGSAGAAYEGTLMRGPPPGRSVRPARDPQWRVEWVARQLETPLFGRATELDRLLASWAAVVRDRTVGVVLVEGDTVVGKSRLVAEVVRRLGERGVWVATARCSREGGLADLGAASAAAGLLPGDVDFQRGSPAAHDLGFEVAARLVQAAVDRPSLVVLDDAQWLDDQAVHLFRELSDRPVPVLVPATALAIVVVRRGAAPARVLGELARILDRIPVSDHIVLGRLEPLPATDLLLHLLPGSLGSGTAVRPDLLAKAVEVTAGTPGYLVDLTRDRRALERLLDGVIDVPPVVRAQVEARLDDLRAEVVAVLSAAAVAGATFTLADAARGSGLDPDCALDHLEVAAQSRFVVEDAGVPGTHRFPVPLEHQAVLQRMSRSRRALVEERLGVRRVT